MAHALSLHLRERVIAAIAAGASCGLAAERFGVAKASAIRWHARFRSEGEIAAKPMGGDRHSHRIEAHAAAILQAYEARAVRLAFCWSHVRRGFIDLAANGASPIAVEAGAHRGALPDRERNRRASSRGTPPGARGAELRGTPPGARGAEPAAADRARTVDPPPISRTGV